MAADTKFSMPLLTENKSYDRFKTELALWKSVTTVPISKIGPMIVLALPENHSSKIKDKVLENIDLDSLKCDQGYDNLMKFMDSVLAKDSLTDVFEKYVDFEKYARTHESVVEFIEEFDLKLKRLQKFNINLPPEILAFKLLIQANITQEELMLVKSGMNYNEKQTLYEQTKISLKKFKSQSTSNLESFSSPSFNVPSSAGIKTESVNITRGGKMNTDRGSYTRGMGQRNFRPGNTHRFSTSRGAFGRDSRPVNPIGPDGRSMLCKACGSYRHLIKDCPDSWENQRGALYTDYEDVYFTENEEGCFLTNGIFTSEAFGCAVLDSACSSTVCGKEWFDHFMNSLEPNDKSKVRSINSGKVFKFGGGEKLISMGCYEIPACIVGQQVMIVTDVIDSDIPLLLSKSEMKKMQMCLDLKSDTAEIMGKAAILNCTSAGHYCIPILRKEVPVFTVDLKTISDKDRKKELKKLHCVFGHPSAVKLIDLLKDAQIWNPDYSAVLDQIVEECETCQRFRKTPSRSKVALPLSHSFNDIVCIDLKSWNGAYILHMIDMWSRYSMSTFIRNKEPKTVVDIIMRRWIGTFGLMKGLLNDNGGEFSCDETREVASILGVKLFTTAGYSPHQNGLCERVHGVVDLILSKLKMDNPKVDINVLLGWANMAKNSLHTHHGFSSHQLVFGTNPNLPNLLTANPPALGGETMSKIFAEHLNTLHSAREAFIKSEADERLRRALRKKITTIEQNYDKGDTVLYKKEGKTMWLGPATVVAQDGKVIFVRHGGNLIRLPPNRIQKFIRQDIRLDHIPEGDIVEQETNNGVSNRVETNIEDVEHDVINDTSSADNVEPEVVVPRRSLRILNKENNWDVHDHDVFAVHVPSSQQSDEEVIQAKLDELKKLQSFDVYEEVDHNNQSCISTRWVVVRKGSVVKARLVARGFQENEEMRVDSPTVGKSVSRICLTMAASKGWKIKTIDIKSAFLQSDTLNRDVFITPPKEAGIPGKIWKLKKCLYGLSDASRQFFISLSSELKRLGLEQSNLDHTLYMYFENKVLKGMILTHVDDFLYCGADGFEEKVMIPLSKRFVVGSRDEKDFKYIGLHIVQEENFDIFVDQNDYSESIITQSVVKNKNIDLTSEEYTKFRALVGALQWLVNGSRPDLAFDTLTHSCKMKKATQEDLQLIAKTVRRAKEKISNKYTNLGECDHWKLLVFTDASFANMPDGVSSCFGYVALLVGENDKSCVISWKANKIKRVCRSTLASETMALVEGLEECLYLKSLLIEIGAFHKNSEIIAYVDNLGLQNALYSTKLVDDKQTRIDIAAIQQMLSTNRVSQVLWCPTQKQLANVLTKRGASSKLILDVLASGRLI